MSTPTDLLVSALRAVSPRTVARFPRLDVARRDARMVLDSLRGVHPSPLVDRPKRVREEVLEGRVVRIARVERETADAVSLVLEDPTGQPIAHRPGQFVTLLLNVDGKEFRRSYSLSSVPGTPATITVKRTGGFVSGYLNDRARPGDVVRILGPQGSFCVTPGRAPSRVILVAGGSGITPVMSIARTVLGSDPETDVTLVYGNRSEADIIFRDALKELAARHSRLWLRHVLSAPGSDWAGDTGMLDAATAERVVPIGDAQTHYFLCGPAPMMDAVRSSLVARGVDAARIHEERFTRSDVKVTVTEPQAIRLRLKGRTLDAVAQPGQTVLEAFASDGVTLPHSCAMGGCGACKGKLVSGQVDLETPNCLTAEERAAGYVLTCIARATEPAELEIP